MLSERLKSLYPKVNVTETPLTTSWNPREKYNYLGLSNNNLRVHYKGGPGKSLKDAASVRGMHSIPAACGVYYFEIRVISKGKNGYVGVGLSDRSAPLSRLPGWEKCSYGYHADDGKAFASSAAGEDYGPTFTTGDVIGCGINLMERNIFYTKNGINLGIAFRDIPPQMNLYPTVGLQTHGEVVEANFGGQPFVFDFGGLLAETKMKVTKTIKCFPLGDSEAKCQTEVHKLVLDYLTVHGYSATAESFARSTGQQLRENMTSIRNRQKILNLVLAGQIGEAIHLTHKLYPGLMEDNQDLLFRLKCQQFVEMIMGNDTACGGTLSPTYSISRSHSSLSSHSSHQSVRSSSLPTSPHTPSDNVSPSNPSRVFTNVPTADNGCISNGMNGSIGNSADDEDCKCVDRMDTRDSTNVDLTGLPCGGNRMAIERLLLFGQDLQHMLQTMPSSPKKPQLQEQLHDVFSLIAYADIKSSPISHLADVSRREPVCEALNIAISGSLQLPVCSPLEESLGHANECLKLMAQNGLGASGFVGVHDCIDQTMTS